MKEYVIDNKTVSLADIHQIQQDQLKLRLGGKAIAAISKCRTYLDHRINDSDDLIYGVNTGFGSLCNTAISKGDLSQLQVNLVRSHACGTGELVPQKIVKTMLMLKAIGLAQGHSGVKLDTVERLLFLYNEDVIPVVYQQGSLGASGDLAPLAHISLVLLGEGEVYWNGERVETRDVYQQLGLEPIQLASKEGLALLNGTQFMSAYLVHAVLSGQQLVRAANINAALSIEAYDGRLNPFTAGVNEIRKQLGQIEVAQEVYELLKDSQLIQAEKQHVQDPYCLRCVPQVHGATLDTINHAVQVVEREINAVTDNPTIFPDTDEVISAGNFHGQPLALVLDFMAIALAELGSIAERRIYKLMSGERGLPPFLVPNSGLNSGFMIAQYTAASIVSQNKQLCTPASVDSIDSSNGQEDHVSMGANAATKLARIQENVYQILGIEIMAACQALEFRDVMKTSIQLKQVFDNFRMVVPFIEKDVFMSPLLQKSKEFIESK
jgi:histidine ammonia-lyase